MSIDGNLGQSQGGVKATSRTGITITEPGNYWCSFEVVLENQESNDMEIVVALVQNGKLDLNDPNAAIGNQTNAPRSIRVNESFSGCLLDIQAGTTLNLVVANAEPPQEQPKNILIYSWTIHCFKIPCIQSSSQVIPNDPNNQE